MNDFYPSHCGSQTNHEFLFVDGVKILYTDIAYQRVKQIYTVSEKKLHRQPNKNQGLSDFYNS